MVKEMKSFKQKSKEGGIRSKLKKEREMRINQKLKANLKKKTKK